MLKITSIKEIKCNDWDKFITETYGKVYQLQQQDGCKERGTVELTIPFDCTLEEKEIGEQGEGFQDTLNGFECPVLFSSWLERNPEQVLVNQEENYELTLFWQRDFYPQLQMVANDLHAKGLIDAGNYSIKIDW